MKNLLTVFLLLTCGLCSAQISSISNGVWTNPSIWDGGVVPDSTDSVTINHFVVYTSKIVFSAGGSVTIANGATLCGEDTFQTLCGARSYNYGTLTGNAVYLTDGLNDGVVNARFHYKNAPCLANYLQGIWTFGYPFSCNSTGENEVNQLEEVKLFPNPVSDYLNIIDAGKETLEFVLYDLNSSKTILQAFTNSTTINTAQMQPGIYFYELRNDKGTIKTGKVVKQ